MAKLRAEFDAGADYNLVECEPGDLDPHAVSSIFKTFLRELPSSLLTRELHMRFLAVMGAWSSIIMPRAFDKYGY